MPQSGPRSVGRFGRRLIAIVIDWLLAYGLSFVFFRLNNGETNPWITLGIFALLQLIFLLFFNGSIGHLLLRMRLVPITGGAMAPWRPVVRTVLLCLAVPALIWDRDQRGLHDRAGGTVLVRV